MGKRKAVNTSTTPKVQYKYSEMSGGANHSRLTSIIYPNGRTISYNYASGLADSISRLSSSTDSGTTLESYSYLGLGTVVIRSHPQPGVDLTYVKQTGEANGDAGDQYIGLDRFGRVVDQRWILTSNGTATDRFQYGYDRYGNRLSRTNAVNSAFNETYSYDNLNQLSSFARGSHTQSWGFDALGNWTSFITDGTTQTRSANAQNEITSISGATTPAYDANGSMTTDQTGKTLVYDAWNRMVQYKNGSTVLLTYSFDALNRRITENGGTLRVLYYSSNWQVLEERVSGTVVVQYVWSPVYIDAMIERDRSVSGTLDERLYVQQDANWNVTAVVSTSGSVVEREVYDPYGVPTFLNASWSALSASGYAWFYLHQGGRFEIVSGLYQFRNRELSAALGRWMQVDPCGFGAEDPNFYRAFAGNPGTLVDPDALASIKYALNGEASPSTMRLEDGIVGYRFSLDVFWKLKDMPNAKVVYFVQGNKVRTFGVKSDGSTWEPPNSAKGITYVVDSAQLAATATSNPDNVGFSFKEAEFNKKTSWVLFYHKVEKHSGFSKLDWKPSVKSGSEVPKATYDEYLKAIRPNFGQGEMEYTYIYINCTNAKKNNLDINKLIAKFPADIGDAFSGVLKGAKVKIGDNPDAEVLSSSIFDPNPIVGKF